MTDSKPHFIARKLQDAQRLAAKGLLCPHCEERFQAEHKLWAHAKSQHHQALNITATSDEAEIRKQFRYEATEKTAKSSPRQISKGPPPAASKPSSNDNDSMQPNIGEDVRSRSPQETSPVPDSTHDAEERIDDLAKLTLSQGNPRSRSNDDPKSPSTPYNPLKRPVGMETGLSDQVVGGKPDSFKTRADAFKTRARRAKLPSAATNDSPTLDYSHDRPLTSDGKLARSSLGSGRRLFDPNLDSPISSTVRPNHNSDHAFTTRHSDDTRTHATRSRRLPSASMEDHPNVDFIHGHPVQQQPVVIMKPHHGSNIMDLDQNNPEVASPTGTAQDDGWMQDQEYDPAEPVLLLQPETRPISHDQLVVEVKGIYAGLVLVETKCIDVDDKQSKAAQEKDPSRQTRLTNEQWQALIHLHKTLLHEHHDFFLASQHPSASPALSKLAAKYSMPARMWHHGIHAFLEVLRHRLPESLDHMLAFIYIAYSMMALLYETVSTFEDTWIECLGDLGRYRMAIEDDDQRDRDVWSGVARFWYSKAADKSPNTGRLYHHLAILARPYTLQQLSYYTRSLTCITPFENARSSIMTLFNLVLNGKESAYHRSTSIETIFIKAHGTMFCNRPIDQFESAVLQLENGGLDNHIGRVTSKFKEQGVFAMVANISAMFEYGPAKQGGLSSSRFRAAYEEVEQRRRSKAKLSSQGGIDKSSHLSHSSHGSGNSTSHSVIHPQKSSIGTSTPDEETSSQDTIARASRLTFSTLSISLQRVGDKNVWPLVHVSLVFLWSLTLVDKAMKYVERSVPWSGICSFLNNLAKPEAITTARIWADAFPHPDGRPLPEDFQIRGQPYSRWYHPDKWFTNATIDDEERTLELPSMTALRAERILWLGMRIASSNRWIAYDLSSQAFKIAKYASEELDVSSSVVHVNYPKGSDRRVKGQPQQPLGPQARLSELANTKTVPQEAIGDTSMVGGLENVVAVENSPVKPEDPHTVSWLHERTRNQFKDPSKEALPQKFESKPLKSDRIDIYDDGSNDLTTN